MLTFEEAARLDPSDLRENIARGQWTRPTSGLAPGYLQANLVILPRHCAFDFLLFCQRNPRPCPVLEVTDPGDPRTRVVADGDLRFDLGRYRVFSAGRCVAEPTSLENHWRDDLVGFLLGCSLTFEEALLRAGVPLRHQESGRALPVYRTDIECRPAGPFHGPMAVSMRPLPGRLVSRAVEVTGRFPLAHGAPIHVGDPEAIGIADLDDVYYGDPPVMQEGDVPVFTACGVTPQMVAEESGLEFMITHYPEHMLVCDTPGEQLAFM